MSTFEQILYEAHLSVLSEQGLPPMPPGAPAAPGAAPAMPPMAASGAPAAPGAPAGAPPAAELSKSTEPTTKQDIDEPAFALKRMESLVQLGLPKLIRFVKQTRNKAESFMLMGTGDQRNQQDNFKSKYPEYYDLFNRFVNATKEGPSQPSPETEEKMDDNFESIRDLSHSFSDLTDILQRHITTISNNVEPSAPEQAPM